MPGPIEHPKKRGFYFSFNEKPLKSFEQENFMIEICFLNIIKLVVVCMLRYTLYIGSILESPFFFPENQLFSLLDNGM